jgi:hypothetical protein
MAKQIFERTQKTGVAVLIANVEKSLKECQKDKDALDIFKIDLGTFVRFYDFKSQIINRLNEVFVTDQLTDKEMVNYAYTIRDKVGENTKVMKQIENNSAEQALLGDFSKAIDHAILDSSEAHQNQMMQLLADPSKAANFARIVFDLLVQGQARNP